MNWYSSSSSKTVFQNYLSPFLTSGWPLSSFHEHVHTWCRHCKSRVHWAMPFWQHKMKVMGGASPTSHVSLTVICIAMDRDSPVSDHSWPGQRATPGIVWGGSCPRLLCEHIQWYDLMTDWTVTGQIHQLTACTHICISAVKDSMGDSVPLVKMIDLTPCRIKSIIL